MRELDTIFFRKTPFFVVLVSSLYIGCWMIFGTLEWRRLQKTQENELSAKKLVSHNRLRESDEVENDEANAIFDSWNEDSRYKRNYESLSSSPSDGGGGSSLSPSVGGSSLSPSVGGSSLSPSVGGSSSSPSDGGGDSSSPPSKGGEGSSPSPSDGSNKRCGLIKPSDVKKLKELFNNHNDFVPDKPANVLDYDEKNQNIQEKLKEIFFLTKKLVKRGKRGAIEELKQKIIKALLSEEMKQDIREALAKLAQVLGDKDGSQEKPKEPEETQKHQEPQELQEPTEPQEPKET